jgi:hypothetical protein
VGEVLEELDKAHAFLLINGQATIWALLIEGMIFSEKGRGAPFLRKNHPWILQPPICSIRAGKYSAPAIPLHFLMRRTAPSVAGIPAVGHRHRQ